MAERTTRSDGRLGRMRESVEHVWLAGLGALALAEEQGSEFYHALVKRGEQLERGTRKRLRRAVVAARGAPATTLARVEDSVDGAVEGVLRRLGVPTQRDIAGLTRRVEALAASLEARPTAARPAARAAGARSAPARSAPARRTTRGGGRAPRRDATT